MSKLIVTSLISALLLALATIAAACDGGEELSLEEYFRRVEAISNERSEQSDALEARFDDLEEGDLEGLRGLFVEALAVSTDAFDELADIDPPAEVEDAHNEFVAAGEAFAEVFEDVVDELADAKSLAEFAAVIQADRGFDVAKERVDAGCSALEEIAADNDIDVDLNCGE